MAPRKLTKAERLEIIKTITKIYVPIFRTVGVGKPVLNTLRMVAKNEHKHKKNESV